MEVGHFHCDIIDDDCLRFSYSDFTDKFVSSDLFMSLGDEVTITIKPNEKSWFTVSSQAVSVGYMEDDHYKDAGYLNLLISDKLIASIYISSIAGLEALNFFRKIAAILDKDKDESFAVTKQALSDSMEIYLS